MTLLAAPDPLAERDQVAGLVEQLLADGSLLTRLRWLHATVPCRCLHTPGGPQDCYPSSQEHSLSSRPLIRSLLSLMRAAANPLDTAALRVVLAPWWKPVLLSVLHSCFARKFTTHFGAVPKVVVVQDP